VLSHKTAVRNAKKIATKTKIEREQEVAAGIARTREQHRRHFNFLPQFPSKPLDLFVLIRTTVVLLNTETGSKSKLPRLLAKV
jgi:hypothetical protein